MQLLKALEDNIMHCAWKEKVLELNEKGLNLTLHDNFCISLTDHFAHHGMHGKHYCTVFPIMGNLIYLSPLTGNVF